MFEKLELINFDREGNIIPKGDIKFDTRSAFGNRTILNMWSSSNSVYMSRNSVGIEDWFNPVPWCEIQGHPSTKYFWGNDCLKKVEPRGRIGGCSPMGYSKFLLEKKYSPKYQTVYFPKTDMPAKTGLTPDKKKIEEFIDELKSLNLDNPLYIYFNADVSYWKEHLPQEILDKSYSMGHSGFDTDWVQTQKNIFDLSEVVYTNNVTSTCVYASFHKIPVKCLKTRLLIKPDFETSMKWYDLTGYKRTFEEASAKTFTVSPEDRPPIWGNFMDYLVDVFENDREDKNYWIYNLLSLDRIEQPRELFDRLNILHKNYLIECPEDLYEPYWKLTEFKQTHDLYDQTKEYFETFNSPGSTVALDYYEKL